MSTERPAHTNRLAGESSPYLLQHAHNPVEWWPWCDDAFAEARRRDLPIFLSIGYSTCYWCHVMERESFESEEIAALLNEAFICVKVDREQRPDVDDIYMTACQIYTQLTEGHPSGGWPLSAFLDPGTRMPFVMGTYFPPKGAFGRPGLPQVVAAISKAWREQRQEVIAQAERLGSLVARQLSEPHEAREVGEPLVRGATERLLAIADRIHGGFGEAPKFPQPVYLELLLEARGDEPAVQKLISLTLDRMACGGIFDQAGGGFHRYAVDGEWQIPHFEKMLYDNGQLASLYARWGERSATRRSLDTARRICEYVLREMTDPSGLFWSAQDAEVDAREGLSYLWSPAQVRDAIADPVLADFALRIYGLGEEANFRDPHHPDASPAHVLRLDAPTDELAAAMHVGEEELRRRLERVNHELLAARGRRRQPSTDDKTILGWNGLMIEGLAEAGRVLRESRFVDAASRAAGELARTMRADDGSLLRIRRGGRAEIPAFLEDHALFARGLLALHRATCDPAWFAEARQVVEAAESRFADPQTGGWYDGAATPDLFVRARSADDGAIPSGTGTMLNVLVTLHELTGDARWLDRARRALHSVSGALALNPLSGCMSLVALHRISRVTRGPIRASFGRHGGGWRVDLEIAAGYHINAHHAGDPTLVGLAIETVEPAVTGAAKPTPIRIDYPPGTPWRDGVLVHTGRVSIPLWTSDEGTLPPRLRIRVQACTDSACLAPQHIEPGPAATIDDP